MLDSVFVWLALMVGAGQMVDAFLLLRHEGAANPSTMAFSFLELVWSFICIIHLATGGDAPLLAFLFIAYVPVSFAVALKANPQIYQQAPDNFKLPLSSVYCGGYFGAIHFAVALLHLFS